jgi:hypothetical protein
VWGSGVQRTLRLVHTPELLPGDEVEVTALWDLRDGWGEYSITVSGDEFSQIAETRTDYNAATVHLTVVGTRVDMR